MSVGDSIKKARDKVRDVVNAPMKSEGLRDAALNRLQGKVADKIGHVIMALAEVNTEASIAILEELQKLNKNIEELIKLHQG